MATTKKESIKNLIPYVYLVLFLGFGLWAVFSVKTNPKATIAETQKTTRVENMFVDINGDGLTDLLVSGEVIINGEQPVNFQNQP